MDGVSGVNAQAVNTKVNGSVINSMAEVIWLINLVMSMMVTGKMVR